jgi:hypothetical protein
MNTTYDVPPVSDGGYPAGTSDPSAGSRMKRWHRWGAGAALAGFLIGGGITLAAVSGGGSPALSHSGSTALSGSGSAQASELNSALGTAASNSSTVSPARVRWALGRLRLLGGVEGTVTFHNKTGFHTLSFERGTIQSVSGSDVVIKSPDGTTWTWQIVSDTVVRKNGSKAMTSALSAGETVFAAGPVSSGARDARLIVIRPSAPAGSQSAQTSLS